MRVKATEDLERRVSLDAVLLAEVGLLGAVDLCELDVLALELGGCFLILGSEGLAVAAPGGVELGQDEVMLLDEVLEGVCLQGMDVRRVCRGVCGEHGGSERDAGEGEEEATDARHAV